MIFFKIMCIYNICKILFHNPCTLLKNNLTFFSNIFLNIFHFLYGMILYGKSSPLRQVLGSYEG